MADSNDLIFQASIDMARTTKGIEEGLKSVKPPTIDVPIEVTSAQAMKAVDALQKALALVSAELDESTAAALKLDDAAKKAADSLKKAVPEAAKLAQALDFDKTTATAALDDIEAKVKQIGSAMQNVGFDPRIQKGFTDDALKLRTLYTYAEKYTEAIRLAERTADKVKLFKESQAGMTPEDRRNGIAGLERTNVLGKHLSEEFTDLRKRITAELGLTSEATNAFFKAINTGLQRDVPTTRILAQIFAPQDVNALTERVKDALATIETARKQVAKASSTPLSAFQGPLQKFQGPLQNFQGPLQNFGPAKPLTSAPPIPSAAVQQQLVRTLISATKEATANIESKGDTTISIGVDKAYLLRSVREALAAAEVNADSTINIGADKAFLLTSIRESLASIEASAAPTVNVGADKVFILKSLREALASIESSPESTVNVGADRAFLLKSIRDSLASFADQNFMIDVGINKSYLLQKVREGLADISENGGLKLKVQSQAATGAKRTPDEIEAAETTRLTGRARTRGLREDARANPGSVFGALGRPDLSEAFSGIKKASGSGDEKMLQSALEFRQEFLNTLNNADFKNIPRDLRVQVEAIAGTLDKAIFQPLVNELALVQQVASTAAKRGAKQATDKVIAAQKASGEEYVRMYTQLLEEQSRGTRKSQKAADAAYEKEFKQLLQKETKDMGRAESEAIRMDGKRTYKLFKQDQDALKQQENDRKYDFMIADKDARQNGRQIAFNRVKGAPDVARGFINGLAPNAVKDFDTLVTAAKAVKDPTVDPLDKRAILQQAREAGIRFNEEILRVLGTSITEARKAALRATMQGVGSTYITPLNNNKTVERKASAQDAFNRLAADLSREIALMGARSFDFGNGAERDTRKEQLKALNDYRSQALALEKQLNGFTTARTQEEREAGLDALQTARARLRITEEELKYRVLATRGDVKAPQLAFEAGGARRTGFANQSKADAYSNISSVLRNEFDKTLIARNERGGRGTTQAQVQQQVFGGNLDVGKDYLRSKGVSEAILRDNIALTAELKKHLDPLREAYALQKQLDGEIRRGVNSLKEEEKVRSQIAASSNVMAGFGRSLRNAAGLIGGIGIGYTAVNQIRTSVRDFASFQQEIAGIQGVLGGRNARDAQILGEGVQDAAIKYGVNLVEAAKSARVFAQAGLGAADVVKQLNLSFSAVKAIGLTIEQVQELQLAVIAVTASNDKFSASLDYTQQVLEKISNVEAKFAVSGQDLAAGLQILSPILEAFAGDITGTADVFDIANGLITTAVERLRITGTQAANALKFVFSRLTRPEIAGKLQKQFQLNLGGENGKDLLPLEQLVPMLAQKYKEINATQGSAKAFELVNTLSGGRQSNVLLAILQEQDRYLQAVNTSATAFGGIQSRAAISTDTLATSLGKANAAFDTFVAQLADSSNFGKGAQAVLETLSRTLSGFATSGKVGTSTGLLSAVLLGAGGLQGGKFLYKQLAELAKGKKVVDEMSKAVAGLGAAAPTLGRFGGAAAAAGTGIARFATVAGGLAKYLGPGGVLLSGLIAGVSLLGLFTNSADKAAQAASKIEIKTLAKLDAENSPAAVNFRDAAVFNKDRRSLGQFNLNFNNQESAFAAVSSFAESPELSTAIKKLRAELKDFEGTNDQLFSKLADENPKRLRVFADEISKIFVKQLPEDSRKGFEALKTNSEKIGQVQALLGNAAVLANLQIADSIDQIRQATNRSVEEALLGLKRMEDQSTLSKLVDGQRSLSYNIEPLKEPSGRIEIARQQANNILLKTSLNTDPELAKLFKTDQFRKILEGVLRDVFDSGETISAGRVLGTALQRASKDTKLVRFDQNGGLQLPGEPAEASRLIGSGGEKAGVEAFFAARQKSAVDKVNALRPPVNQKLADASQVLQQSLAGVLGTSLIPGKKATESAIRGLNRFTDALLNTVLGAFTEITRNAREIQIAKDLGTGFDVNSSRESLGRSLIGSADSFKDSSLTELVKLQRQKFELEERLKKATGSKGGKAQQEDLQSQITVLQEGIASFDTATLSEILGAGAGNKEGAEVMKVLVGFITSAGVEQEVFLKALREAGVITASTAITSKRNYASQIQDAELLTEAIGRQGELALAQLPITARAAARSKIQLTTERLKFEQQLKTNALNAAAVGADAVSLDLQQKRLATTYLLTQAHQAQLDVLVAQRALDEQARTNIEGQLSGVRKLLTDPSIFADMYAEEDPTKRWAARVKVMQKILMDAVAPIFTTISDRIFTTLQDALVDKLLNVGPIADLAKLGEARLKQDVDSAQILYTSILTASQLGAQEYYKAILAASAQVGGVGGAGEALPQTSYRDSAGTSFTEGSVLNTASLVGTLGPKVDKRTMELLKVGMGAATPGGGGLLGVKSRPKTDAEKKAALDQKKFYARAIGQMGGQILGTMAGKGGAGAQQGSQIGSSVGTLAAPYLAKLFGAAALGGPFGIAIAGIAGGLLGGVLGGKTDKKKEENNEPVVTGLEAIERKQTETIQTIQSQTDALLKPDNRLLNLPSSFNIPNYQPNFGGGSGGGGGAGMVDNRRITINVNGGNVQEVRRVVEETLAGSMGGVLDGQRRNQRWN